MIMTDEVGSIVEQLIADRPYVRRVERSDGRGSFIIMSKRPFAEVARDLIRDAMQMNQSLPRHDLRP